MFSKQTKTQKFKIRFTEEQHEIIEKSIKLAKEAKGKLEFFRSRPAKDKLSLQL